MKTLYLLRHAQSSWDSPQERDFDRPLNTQGLEDTPEMVSKLRTLLQRQGVPLTAILSSPALRTRTTAEIFARAFGVQPAQITYDPQIYLASSGRLLQLVRRIDDNAPVALLVAHNPALTDFANEMSNSSIGDIPTCGMVTLQLAAEHWSQADFGNARLMGVDFPHQDAVPALNSKP